MYTNIADILRRERERQNNTAELIASENFASDAVRELCGSEFTNKYAEGYPGRRYYNGCEHMDEIETLARQNLNELYGSAYCNVQPHSGANANTAVYQAFLKPRDTILGMDLASGGHLSHGARVNQSGKLYDAGFYGVDSSGWIDYDEVFAQAKAHHPQMIIAGASAYPRQIDWARFKEIADYVGAYLMVDMSHYSGLIAGGVYDNPLPYADVVTSTTHKSLRGPRGGMILWNDPDYTRKINSAVFPGTQGGPLMNIIAAKAQCYQEALEPSFSEYSQKIIDNAKTLTDELHRNQIPTVTMGTDSHLVLVDLRDFSVSGKLVADGLERNGITVNKNGVPNDPRSFTETSGIRIGTAAETTRGRSSEWFRNIAQQIATTIHDT